jgi:hypothetical protein
LDFDFSRAQSPLEPIRRSDLIGEIEDEWLRLYLFGQQRYAEGGGASPLLGVDSTNGEIYGLDVERETSSATFFLNSGVHEFVQMFLLFDGVLRFRRESVHSIPSVAEAIDSKGFAKSEWRDLAVHLIKRKEPPTCEGR